MKTYVIFLMTLLAQSAGAQPSRDFPQKDLITPFRVEVTAGKTTALLFSRPVTTVDMGSGDIAVEPVAPHTNVLKLKAVHREFGETSLLVVTDDGRLYPFVVDYTAQPVYITVRVPASGAESTVNALTERGDDNTYCHVAANAPRNIFGRNAQAGAIWIYLKGLYIRDDMMYARFEIDNRSAISYDADPLRLYIRDIRTAKRTAYQETAVPLVARYGNQRRVNAYSHGVFVVAFRKLTLPPGRMMVAELRESGGNRTIQLRIGRHCLHRLVALR